MPEIINSNCFNVLIAGDGTCIDYIKTSDFLGKLYTTSEIESEGVINIKFNTFKELAKKCKALQIDFVIPENQRWINEGISNVLRSSYVNCIAPDTKWTELGIPNIQTRKMLEKYEINIPPITLVPAEFPLILKGNGVSKLVNSVQEIIDTRQDIHKCSPAIAKDLYLEKYLDGKTFVLTSLFDTKNLITFPSNEIPQNLFNEYTKKLENMLKEEKADFIGFINSTVILCENKLYNTGFSFEFHRLNCNIDILYILSLAIYQKLNEVDFNSFT